MLYEPDVTLTIPTDPTDDPVAAVEDFIAQVLGQPHLWSYSVQIGPKTYHVDMDATPPIVTEVTRKG